MASPTGNLIVCPEPPAAEVGREIFSAGGNAIDAAVAACFAQAVTNPLLCGIGGSSLLYYYDGKTGQSVVLNGEASIGSRPEPSSWPGEFVGRSETIGRYIIKSEANQVGHQSVMTPGFVRVCWVAHKLYGSGKLSWQDLLMPGARLANDGFAVYPYIASHWHRDEPKPGYPGLMVKLDATPDARRCYLKPDGSTYQEGDWLRQPDLGRTIERLAECGGEDFYTGEIARVIADDFERHQGFTTAEDLRDYAVEEEPVLRGHYRGLEVVTAIAPSGGPQLLEILHTLEHFNLAHLGHNTPEYIDIFARVQRATFADHVGLKGVDAAAARALEQEVVGEARAAYWAARINGGDRIVVRGGAVDHGTTHVSVMDTSGNIVSCCHSIGSIAGSGVITSGLGFLYNNFLGHHNPLPGQPDSIVPGRRAGGSLPTVVFRDGRPYITAGAPGGSRIITAVAQSIVNVVDHGMDMMAAVSMPRFHSEEEQVVYLEAAVPETTAEALRGFGNDVRRSEYQARVQAIRALDNGDLEAGADPRGGQGVGRHP